MKHTVATTIAALQAHGLPDPVAEFRFHPTRRWRVDFCWVDFLVVLELEGLSRYGGPGRHQRTNGFVKDIEKYNALCLMGYTLIRATSRQVASGQCLAWLEIALGVASIQGVTT